MDSTPHGKIAHVRLNRPDKLNALDIEMFEAIAQTIQTLRDDTSANKNLRAVIVSGQGRAFCTGLDVKGMVRSNPFHVTSRLLRRPSGYEKDDDASNTLAVPEERTMKQTTDDDDPSQKIKNDSTTTTTTTTTTMTAAHEENVEENKEGTMDPLPLPALGNLAQDVGYLWRSLPVPVIAVLHGMCYGGGERNNPHTHTHTEREREI
jgi:enoyl-CoA hydratase/carnithine racemase